MNHLSSESLLKMAEENLQRAEGGPKDYALEYSTIAVGQALVAIALELTKFNWDSNYESNMNQVRREHEMEHES